MAKLTALCLFIGVLAAPAWASTTCGEDEMDLCVDSTDIKSTTCGEDEMDLCMDLPKCDEDEMDLCIDLPTAPGPAPASVCAEDEMDLCEDYVAPSVCAEDEMDLCVDFVPPSTQAPTPPPTPAPVVTFKGTITFKVDGHVEKVEVEMAAKRTIEMSLPAGSQVFVTATNSRRLEIGSAARRLAESSWSVAWQADVPAASASVAEAGLETMEADTAGFQMEFKKQLVAVGCDAAVAESMEVVSFSSEKVEINSTNKTTEVENTDSAMGLSGKFSIALAIMVSSFMSSSRKPLCLLADVLGVKASAA